MDFEDRKLPRIPRWVFVFALPLVVVACFFKSFFTIVPTGHVGIQTRFGQVQTDALGEGFSFINPLNSVNPLSIQVQKHSANYDASSSDMQKVHVAMYLNYRVDPRQAAVKVYQEVGAEYESKIVDPAAQEVLKAVTAKHQAAEILQNRANIKTEVETNLKAWLDKYGLELKEVSIADIKFDAQYEQAIETKQIEEQKAEQKKYELMSATKQAEIVVAKAKGEAEAMKIKGEAEAAYNDSVAKSLTPTMVQQLYLQKWNGQLPQFMTGDKGNLLLQIDPLKK